MSELKVSVSGVRGIWGDSLTLESLMDYTKAFGEYIRRRGGKRVLIGRDARPTGPMISMYAASILNAMGIDTVDTGIVPTPTVLFGVRKLGFDGGLIITASHNPVEWNALKYVKTGGLFTGEKDIEEIKGYLTLKNIEAPYHSTGKNSNDTSALALHVQAVADYLGVDAIRSTGFKTLIDPVNSAGCDASRMLMEKLGCTYKIINGEIDGTFKRGTEPTPENLRHMEKEVVDFGADIGFATDPDADRLVVVDEKGAVLSEEMTLALAVESVLSDPMTKRGDVVINMSTSKMSEDIAAKYGVRTFRSKVGEANVVETLIANHALIGGEGNGGVIFPSVNTARDSLVGMGLMLQLMARTKKPLSELAAALPRYAMKKTKFDYSGDIESLYNRIVDKYKSAEVSRLDGLRIDWREGDTAVWAHIRPSNTEPVVRLIGEAGSAEVLDRVFAEIGGLL
ncbi:MAG: phosphoglucosamine mutase [Spirochaetes bacterium GWF1_51_8]|nr:MAG: phosphoglucosamine mutase [Spirochaetes bacterium GWF1_51_8]